MKELLRSKKFRVSLVALVAAIVGHFGLHLDETVILTILSPLFVFVGGQALADIGKEKAKVELGE